MRKPAWVDSIEYKLLKDKVTYFRKDYTDVLDDVFNLCNRIFNLCNQGRQFCDALKSLIKEGGV